MSVNTFLKTVWESRLLTNYSQASIAEVITTPPTEITGKSITFNRIAPIKAQDYSGVIKWEDVETISADLHMDQKKQVSRRIDDVDKAQAAGDIVDAVSKAMSISFNEDTDAYVLGLYTDAHQDNVIGSDASPKQLTRSNAYDEIVNLGTKLSNKKVPKSDRYVTVSPDVLGLLAQDDRFTRQPNVLENGIVEGQKINGLQVVESIEVNSGDGKVHIVANHKSALGFGKQIDKLEAMRLENSFSDGIRSLLVYGATVLHPEGVAVLTGTIGQADDGESGE